MNSSMNYKFINNNYNTYDQNKQYFKNKNVYNVNIDKNIFNR